MGYQIGLDICVKWAIRPISALVRNSIRSKNKRIYLAKYRGTLLHSSPQFSEPNPNIRTSQSASLIYRDWESFWERVREMDAIRKQLDQLMGANRNGDVREVNRKYFDRDVCRLYLVGLCPHELFQLTVIAYRIGY